MANFFNRTLSLILIYFYTFQHLYVPGINTINILQHNKYSSFSNPLYLISYPLEDFKELKIY